MNCKIDPFFTLKSRKIPGRTKRPLRRGLVVTGMVMAVLLSCDAEPLSGPNEPFIQQIAFMSRGLGFGDNWEIVVIDEENSLNKTILTDTTDGISNGFPAWSPDGTKIVYVSTGDGNREVYIMDADGSNKTRLTNNSNTEVDPVWSPDGSALAYHSNRAGFRKIHSMNSDGSQQIRLNSLFFNEFDASWSPDGNKIALSSDRDGPDGIFVMNADGSGILKHSDASANSRWPTWSK